MPRREHDLQGATGEVMGQTLVVKTRKLVPEDS